MANITIEIKTRIDRIKANVQNWHNSRKEIIEDLIYLKDHKKELKAVTGKNLDEIIKDLGGISRRYFNQLVSNYKFLEQYGKTDLFSQLDTKLIEHAKKKKDPSMLDNAQLKRSNFGRPSPVLDAEIIHPMSEGTYELTADGYKKAPMSAQEPRSGAITPPPISQDPPNTGLLFYKVFKQGPENLPVHEALEMFQAILRKFSKADQIKILEQLRHLVNEGKL